MFFSIKQEKGFTYVELVVTIAIMGILLTVMYGIFQPTEQRAKARDEVRLGNLTTLERIINEYAMDNKVYPDAEDITRVSNLLPGGNAGPLESITQGWIAQNLSSYAAKLPTDPINDDTYHYFYRHTLHTYEIDARLEYYTDKAQNDGGNDPNMYEVGNDLTVI